MMSGKSKAGDVSDPEDHSLALIGLQIELVVLQRHLIKSDQWIAIIFESRDALGEGA